MAEQRPWMKLYPQDWRAGELAARYDDYAKLLNELRAEAAR